MKLPLRQALADSHVSAVAIVILLVWSLGLTFRACWEPFLSLGDFVITAVAIRGIPSSDQSTNFADRSLLIVSCAYLFDALCTAAMAWLLSRWVYGTGPIRTFSSYRGRLARRSHA